MRALHWWSTRKLSILASGLWNCWLRVPGVFTYFSSCAWCINSSLSHTLDWKTPARPSIRAGRDQLPARVVTGNSLLATHPSEIWRARVWVLQQAQGVPWSRWLGRVIWKCEFWSTFSEFMYGKSRCWGRNVESWVWLRRIWGKYFYSELITRKKGGMGRRLLGMEYDTITRLRFTQVIVCCCAIVVRRFTNRFYGMQAKCPVVFLTSRECMRSLSHSSRPRVGSFQKSADLWGIRFRMHREIIILTLH